MTGYGIFHGIYKVVQHKILILNGFFMLFIIEWE